MLSSSVPHKIAAHEEGVPVPFRHTTYTVRRDCPAREPSWSVFWLQKPSVLRACVREEDTGGREAGAPFDLFLLM